MPILHKSRPSICFMHDKMGRKMNEDNAGVYPDIKTLIGIRILVIKQMFATITWILFTLLRT